CARLPAPARPRISRRASSLAVSYEPPRLWVGGHGIACREELAQRRVDLRLIGDGDRDELAILDFAIGGHQRAGRAEVALADLAVAEDIADPHELLHERDAPLVIPRQVVAVGEVE